MVVPYKKLPLLVILFLLLLLVVSCELQPYTAQPTETPEPTPTPMGPMIFIKEGNEEGKIIDNAILKMKSSKDKEVPLKKTSKKAYHLDTSCNPGDVLYIWAEGYYIRQQPCDGRESYSIYLEKYNYVDDPVYLWKSASLCMDCHTGSTNGVTQIAHGEYLEWGLDNHSRAYSDQIFLGTYLGANGEPGFLLDNPGDFGNCGFCHTPAGLDAPQTEVDIKNLPQKQSQAAFEGVTCDVCHKVAGVNNSSDTIPYLDHPGALSYQFLRPPDDNANFYLGPKIFADIDGFGINANGSAITYAPVFQDSQFCAPCHYGKFWDVEIYNSYGEWNNSAYSNKEKKKNYKTCQDCHMSTAFERQKSCLDLVDDASPVTTHNMMIRKWEGRQRVPCLVKDAASMDVKVKRLDASGQIQVSVSVYNQYAGHKFPTDSPLRHLILVVEARDKNGRPLFQVDGPTIPLWGGIGNPQNGEFAGQAGKIFAYLLMEEQTSISPTTAYWRKVTPAYADADTRLLPPQGYKDNQPDYAAVTDTSKYQFPAPSGGGNINVRLIYRYAPIDLVRSKGWISDWFYPYTLLNDQPLDIIVTEQNVPF